MENSTNIASQTINTDKWNTQLSDSEGYSAETCAMVKIQSEYIMLYVTKCF